MKLDKLLGKLVESKGGKRKIKRDFNSSYLVDTVEKLSRLEVADVYSKEGLSEYRKITGDKAYKYTTEDLEFRKKARFVGGNQDLSEYICKHTNKLIKELDDEGQIGLAFRYCPQKSNKDRPKYERARKVVRKSVEELEEISKDTKQYMTDQLKNESGVMKHYMTMFADEFIQIRQNSAQRKAVAAIKEYEGKSRGKFLKDSAKQMRKEDEKREKKREKVVTRIREYEAAGLDAKKYAKLIKEDVKDLKHYNEKYPDAENLKKFTRELATIAVQQIREKKGYEPMEIRLSDIIADKRYDISQTSMKDEMKKMKPSIKKPKKTQEKSGERSKREARESGSGRKSSSGPKEAPTNDQSEQERENFKRKVWRNFDLNRNGEIRKVQEKILKK